MGVPVLLPVRLSALLAIIAALSVFPQSGTFSFRPLTAEYSKPLDRIIMVSDNPPRLHVVDPLTNSIQSVTLANPPRSLRLSPGGTRAVVAHDQLVSWVDLIGGVVEKTFAVPFHVQHADASETWIWVRGGYEGASIEVSSGALTRAANQPNGVFRFVPRLNALVGTDGATGSKIDVANGVMGQATVFPWNLGQPVCYDPALSEDQLRLFTTCRQVWRLGDSATDALSYETSLGAAGVPNSGSDSSQLGLVAAMPVSNTPSANRREVLLFDTAYFNPAGRLMIVNMPATSITRGRWVFFNAAATALHVVTESFAMPAAVPENGFQTIPLQPSAGCGAVFAATGAETAAVGAAGRIEVNAAPDCRYMAASDVPWIEILGNGLMSGTQSINYIVRPNSSDLPRSGILTLPGSSLRVTQDARVPPAPSRRIGYRVVAADFSRSLERLILVTDTPHEIHIYDPATGSELALPLPRRPASVTLNPEGDRAAVGHDGFVTLVDLKTATLLTTLPVQNPVGGMQWARNGFLYFVAGFQGAWSLRLADGAVASFPRWVGGSPRLTSDGEFLYTFGTAISAGANKWDIRGGFPALVDGEPMTFCETLWFYRNREWALSQCAGLFDLSTTPAQRPKLLAPVPGATRLLWADHSALRRSVALIPRNAAGLLYRLDVYPEDLAARSGSLESFVLPFGGELYPATPEYAFWNGAENALVAVVRATDPRAEASPFGVSVTVASAGCSLTPAPPLVNIPFAGGSAIIPIAARDSCVWITTANEPWVRIVAGGFGVGAGNVALDILPNSTGAPRVATVNAGGTEITVAQAAVACTFALSSSTASSGAGASTASTTLTTPPGCGWSAISNAAWLNVTTGATGMGAAGVSIAIAANTGAVFRTGTLTIAGLPFTVTQAGAGAPDPVFQDVPPSHPFYESIGQLHANGITAGCSVAPRLFCPDSSVTRAQMAVLIVTALNKRLRVPLTYPASPYFEDVRPPSPYFPFVQRIRELEITAGCSAVPPLFCGEASITHGQMAVFIIAAWMQANNLTSLTWPATPYFTDVPASHPFFRFIQKMRELGFWSGCSANQYCDTSPVTRGQMSPMIVKGILGAP